MHSTSCLKYADVILRPCLHSQDTQLLLWDFAMEEFASLPCGIASTPVGNPQTSPHPPTPTGPVHTANKPPNLAALNTGSGGTFQPDVNKHPTPRSEPATPQAGNTPQGVNAVHGVTSPHGGNAYVLAPPVLRKEVPKMAPIMAHKVRVC